MLPQSFSWSPHKICAVLWKIEHVKTQKAGIVIYLFRLWQNEIIFQHDKVINICSTLHTKLSRSSKEAHQARTNTSQSKIWQGRQFTMSEDSVLRLQRLEGFIGLLLPLCIPIIQIPDRHITEHMASCRQPKALLPSCTNLSKKGTSQEKKKVFIFTFIPLQHFTST